MGKFQLSVGIGAGGAPAGPWYRADVPIMPPVALAIVAVLSMLLCQWERLQFLPPALAGKVARATIVAADVAVSVWLIRACGAELEAAGSGVAFTDVAGITTSGPFGFSRNPMYVGLVFGALPGCAVLLDSAWPFFFLGPLWLYLHLVVVRAEETMLSEHFGKAYQDYCATTPRYLFY